MKLILGITLSLLAQLSLGTARADDLVLNASSETGASLVLNRQTSSGDIEAALVGRGNQIGASVTGALEGFNGSSLAATAVGNTLSVSLAGGGSREQSASGNTLRSLETTNGSGQALELTSNQANSGNVSSRVDTDQGDLASHQRGGSGSFNTSAITATAVGNTVSINIGGPAR